MAIGRGLLAASTAGLALFAAAGTAQSGCRSGASRTGSQVSRGGGSQYTAVTTTVGNSSEVSFSGGSGTVSVTQTSGPVWGSAGGGREGGSAPSMPLNVTTATPVSMGAGGTAATWASAGGGVVNTGSTGVGGPATVSGGSGGLVNVGPVASQTGGSGGSVIGPVSTGTSAPVGVGTIGLGTVGLGTVGLGTGGLGIIGVGTEGAGSVGATSVSTPISAPVSGGSTPLQLCGACVGALTGGVGG
jgi:hypothetical protein